MSNKLITILQTPNAMPSLMSYMDLAEQVTISKVDKMLQIIFFDNLTLIVENDFQRMLSNEIPRGPRHINTTVFLPAFPELVDLVKTYITQRHPVLTWETYLTQLTNHRMQESSSRAPIWEALCHTLDDRSLPFSSSDFKISAFTPIITSNLKNLEKYSSHILFKLFDAVLREGDLWWRSHPEHHSDREFRSCIGQWFQEIHTAAINKLNQTQSIEIYVQLTSQLMEYHTKYFNFSLRYEEQGRSPILEKYRRDVESIVSTLCSLSPQGKKSSQSMVQICDSLLKLEREDLVEQIVAVIRFPEHRETVQQMRDAADEAKALALSIQGNVGEDEHDDETTLAMALSLSLARGDSEDEQKQ